MSEAHEFVLWWHAKAGCTGLKAWYLGLFGFVVEKAQNGMLTVDGVSVHDKVDRWHNKYTPSKHSSYFHFQVVRHPLRRLVSHWAQQHNCGSEIRNFPNYLKHIVTTPQDIVDRHVSWQHAELEGVKMHLTIKLEDIDSHWRNLMKFLGLPVQDVFPVVNASGAGEKWQEQFTDPTITAIAERHYKEDLDNYYR